VLVDETRVWSVWADLLGVSPFTLSAVLGAAIAQGEDHHLAFPHVAPNVEWQDFEDEHERRFGGIQEQDLYADARPCLQELRELGFTVVVAGNQPARRTRSSRAGPPPRPAVTSEELGVEKPDPAFFEAVLPTLGGERPRRAALRRRPGRQRRHARPRAGWRTCWLRRGPWGHLQELPDDVEPDLVLEGLGELPLLLGEWRR
jgi:FMN hydrolase / 5-amino-6-(5-phospho-D-ribitylamino)uracil phosphatase